jgi:hypothetical protein
VAVVGAILVTTSAGAPAPPSYATTSDKTAVDAALAIGHPVKRVRRTIVAPKVVEQPGQEPKVVVPPGPFDAKAPILVDPKAAADPMAVHGRRLRVMLTGDSVGWTLGWKLGPNLTKSIKLSDRALIGCGVMPPDSKFIVHGLPPEQYGDQCQNAALAETRGLNEAPDAVVLILGAWEVYDHEYEGHRYTAGSADYTRFLDERIQARIDRYRAAGAGTVIAEVPCFGPNAARLGTERHQQRRINWVNQQIRKVARENPGWVRLVKPFGELCDGPGRSKTHTPTGLSLREDGAHFNSQTAVWFWNTWLAPQVGAAFENGTKPWPPVATTSPGDTTPTTTLAGATPPG